MEAKKKFFRFFNFLDAMQLMCPTVHLFFYNKINDDLSSWV